MDTPMRHFPIIAVLGFALPFIASSAWIATADSGSLHDAVKANDRAAVESILAGGADINESDFVLGTPLHVAVARGNLDLAKLLIDRKADLEAVSEREEAKAVHLAAYFGDIDMLRLLLESGADIDARDKYGQTPLHQVALTGPSRNRQVAAGHGSGHRFEKQPIRSDTTQYRGPSWKDGDRQVAGVIRCRYRSEESLGANSTALSGNRRILANSRERFADRISRFKGRRH